jgi:hypothetical protein
MPTTYASYQGIDVFLPAGGRDSTMRAWFIAKNPDKANLSKVWLNTVTLGATYSPQMTELLSTCK